MKTTDSTWAEAYAIHRDLKAQLLLSKETLMGKMFNVTEENATEIAELTGALNGLLKFFTEYIDEPLKKERITDVVLVGKRPKFISILDRMNSLTITLNESVVCKL